MFISASEVEISSGLVGKGVGVFLWGVSAPVSESCGVVEIVVSLCAMEGVIGVGVSVSMGE